MRDLRLSEIWIYPVKSLGGIRLKSSSVMEKGLQYDRRWMLVDASGNFMTQRAHPKMALFKVDIENSLLTIRYNGQSVSTPSNQISRGRSLQAIVWDDSVEVVETSQQVSDWFSENLGTPCKLVTFPEANSRPVDEKYKIKEENVSLADAYPFLIIGEESLADLNQRLTHPLPMNRFRPNFVFSGGEAFEEDHWRNFKIGKNRFAGVKPCGRCTITTINQETAERGIEPLATLATFRKVDGSVYFGQNVIAIDHGEIFEGDEIILD